MSWISALLGLDASHAAGQLAKTSQSQQQLATGYGNQAAGIYGGLNTQGQGQTGIYNQNYLALLQKAGSFAGLGNSLLSLPGQPSGGTDGRTPPGSSPSLPPGATQGASGAARADLYPGGSFPGGGGPQGQDTSDPYSLDPNQQSRLNQSLAGVAQQHQQALEQTKQILAQSGITGGAALAAATETINNHFADLSTRTQTDFYETVKQDKQQALNQIIQELSGFGQQGLQETQSAANGLLGLQSGAQGAQASLQQQSLQQQNLSNEQLSGLLGLVGFATGGGFGGAGGTSAAGGNFAAAGLAATKAGAGG